MFSKIKIALAAVVLSIAFPAMAATKHQHRVTHAYPAIYNTANGGPSCSNARPRNGRILVGGRELSATIEDGQRPNCSPKMRREGL
jgi:hypothetical protein